MSLNEFAADVYSQYGEDGIIAEVLRRLPRRAQGDRWCVEFGAWDGVHLSNTHRLVREEGYRAVLIEGDRSRYADLLKNMQADRVHPINAWVSIDGPCSLDSLLASTPLPREFDLLSVDVDGIDIHLWRSLTAYRPLVVCIEFNPTIPNRVLFEQPPDPMVQWGSSPRSMVGLAAEKGYDLVAASRVNLLFTATEVTSSVLGDRRLTLDEVRDDADAGAVAFVGYDGTLHFDRSRLVYPWHGVSLSTANLRSLPRRARVGGSSLKVRRLALVPIRLRALLVRLRQPRALRRHWNGTSASHR